MKSHRLAGANISNTKLPDDIKDFKGLKHVEELSKHARTIFLLVLAACVFSWLTIATTTDVGLLTNTASTPLPIINVQIPIAGFYWFAPVILLAFYMYLHFYLQSLWEVLAELPAIFPDGRPLDKHAYPWLLSSLVNAHVQMLKEYRPPFSRLKNGFSIIAAWGLVPGTIAVFWVRYLPRHDWVGTVELAVILSFTTVLAIIFYVRMRRTLRGEIFGQVPLKNFWKHRPAYAYGVLFLFILLFGLGVSDGAINGVPKWRDIDSPSGYKFIPKAFDFHPEFIPRAFDLINYDVFADLSGNDISTKPVDYWQIGKPDRVESVIGAKLAHADLRFANARQAFLVGADLEMTDLREANLLGANLQGADLRYAHLDGADLREANLIEAKLWFANLNGADLRNANLQEADLVGASLWGVDLDGANFYGTNLEGADFQGTDLTGAVNLTPDQLYKACGDKNTKLPSYLGDFKMGWCGT